MRKEGREGSSMRDFVSPKYNRTIREEERRKKVEEGRREARIA